MQVKISFKQLENENAKDHLKPYALKKLERLSRYVEESSKLQLVLEERKQRHIAKAVIQNLCVTIKGEESGDTLTASIDLLLDNLEKQLIKYKEKLITKRDKDIETIAIAPSVDTEEKEEENSKPI